MDEDLPQRLVHLGELIEVPREDDGTPATLRALMPCEPAIGEVAVACWIDSDGGELIELVRIDDGSRVVDSVALREALVLLAMVETVEDLASFPQLDEMLESLRSWSPHGGDGALAIDAAPLEATRDEATRAVTALAALAPTDARMARTQRLDELGAALRELERAWTALEAAAETWSDELVAERGSDDAAVVETVQSLWRALGAVRHGPLARPISTALHEARESGAAMAAAVIGSS